MYAFVEGQEATDVGGGKEATVHERLRTAAISYRDLLSH